MYKAIASLGAIATLLHFAPAANAQMNRAQLNNAQPNNRPVETETQAEPTSGAANLLQGLQERTIKHSFPARTSSESTPIRKVADSSDPLGVQLDKNVQLRVKPETDTSQVGVFPGDNNAKGSQFQLIYQFDDQLEQFSRSQK